jgi:O-antigen/teichoic acid export membrane protein
MQANNILNFVIAQCSSFVIGRTAGSHQLGLYTVAHEIGSLPTSEIVAPINRAVYPSYAQMASDAHQLRAGFLHVLSAVTLFAIPAACGIAAIAEPLVVLFLGVKWLEAAALLKILGFLGAVAAISTNTYPAFLALGRPRLPTAVSAVRACVIVPAMVFAAWEYGATGVAWIELGSSFVFIPLSWALLFPLIGVRVRDCIGVIYRPVIAAGVMYFAVRAVLPVDVTTGASASGFVHLLLAVLLGVVLYVAGIVALWLASGRENGAERQVLRLAKERLAVIGNQRATSKS